MTLKFDGWPWKTIGHIFYTMSSFVHHFKAINEFKLGLQSGNAQFGSKSANFVPYHLEIWRVSLKKNMSPFLYYIEFCASFQSHRQIQNAVKFWKRPIWAKIDYYLCRVTLKFDGWPWKTIKHLFYATSSFVHHFAAIGKIKLEFSPETPNSAENRRFFVPCDLEIWEMTLKNNRAPLLCYIKLCPSFRSHLWIRTAVVVRKSPHWGKICFDICDLDLWPLTLTFRTDITFVHDNISWKFHDDTKKMWQKGGRTDGKDHS